MTATNAEFEPRAADVSPVSFPVRPARRTWMGWLYTKRSVFVMLVLASIGITAHREGLGIEWKDGGFTADPYAMLGFDTYMQVIASRIQSWDDFVDTFKEELTDGRIDARFYRPVQNLSIALDYAIWGINPFGYQLSSLLGFGLCIALAYLAARRLLGPNAWTGPIAAGLLIAMHPVFLNVLPVPCRRSDLLVVSFLLMLIVVLPTAGERRVWPRLVLAGLLTMIAAGAKDIGVMGLGLVFLHQFFFRYSGDLATNIGRSVLASIPSALGASLYMVNRTLVLKGFGGYPPREDDATYMSLVLDYGESLLIDLFCPWAPKSWMESGWSLFAIAWRVAVALGALAALIMLISPFIKNSDQRRVGGTIALGFAWLIPPSIVLGALNFYGPWYAPLPLTGIALLVAGIAQTAANLIRRAPWLLRPLALVPAGVTVGVLFPALWCSPLFTFYPEWQGATKVMNKVLNDLDAKLDQAEFQDIVYVTPTPNYVPRDYPPDQSQVSPVSNPKARHARYYLDRPQLSWMATIMVKGIQAYAELKYPKLNPSTVYAHSIIKPGPYEVLIKVQYVEIDKD